jgi:hypothetical protein
MSNLPINFYEKLGAPLDPSENNPNYEVHGIKLPFRMLIVGASGSMKTNTALDIFKKISPAFTKLTIVTRNSDEPLYNLIKKKIPEDSLKIIEIDQDDLSELPNLQELTSKEPPTLVIFDDLVLVKNQKRISEFFIRARKCNISCMYLSQSYFGTPKTIRGNCNIIIFKKISAKSDLNLILRDYTLSLEVDELKKLYMDCTREKLDWLMIKVDNPSGKQMFHNYTELVVSGNESNENEPKKQKTNPDTHTESKSESEPESSQEPTKTPPPSPKKPIQEKNKTQNQEIRFKELQKLLHKYH